MFGRRKHKAFQAWVLDVVGQGGHEDAKGPDYRVHRLTPTWHVEFLILLEGDALLDEVVHVSDGTSIRIDRPLACCAGGALIACVEPFLERFDSIESIAELIDDHHSPSLELLDVIVIHGCLFLWTSRTSIGFRI